MRHNLRLQSILVVVESPLVTSHPQSEAENNLFTQASWCSPDSCLYIQSKAQTTPQ